MWHGAVDLLGSAIVRARVEWRSALRPHGRQMGASVYGAAVSESHCVAETHNAHALALALSWWLRAVCWPQRGGGSLPAARNGFPHTHTDCIVCAVSQAASWKGGTAVGRGERRQKDSERYPENGAGTSRGGLRLRWEFGQIGRPLAQSRGLRAETQQGPCPASASSPERTQRPGVA